MGLDSYWVKSYTEKSGLSSDGATLWITENILVVFNCSIIFYYFDFGQNDLLISQKIWKPTSNNISPSNNINNASYTIVTYKKS